MIDEDACWLLDGGHAVWTAGCLLGYGCLICGLLTFDCVLIGLLFVVCLLLLMIGCLRGFVGDCSLLFCCCVLVMLVSFVWYLFCDVCVLCFDVVCAVSCLLC